MKSSSTYVPSTNVAILCVGNPKSGKTRLGMAFPRPGILDCDGNLSSAVRIAGGKKFLYSRPYETDDGKEIPEVDRWNRAWKETVELLKSPETDTIVIDGLSNLCRWGLVHAENELKKAGINLQKEFFAKYASFIPLLTSFITTLRIPGKYVVVNVHQIIEKDELTGRTSFKLDIPGRLAETLGGQFTDVWGMESIADPTNTKVGAKYSIRTKPSGYHINLGTSLDLAPSIDITDKTPDQIWSLLAPKLSTSTPPVK